MASEDKTALKTCGKGYSYLFAIALTGLLCWQSNAIKYSKADGWEWQTKEVPAHVLYGYLFLVASTLGFDTDKLASAVGRTLSEKEEE